MSKAGEKVWRVYMVEDHPVFREGLAQVINREPDMEVCGQAGNADDGLEAILKLKPDVALVDISLPGKNGLALIRELRRTEKTLKILVVSMHDESLYADRVLRAGGDGYIMKQEDPEEVVQAMRDILAGHTYVSEEVMGSQKKSGKKGHADDMDRLSDSQLEILELIGRGQTTQDIARKLGIAPDDVARATSEICAELNLSSETELLRYAVRWVESA